MSALEERVRQRLREEMTKRNLSQRELATLLGGAVQGWSQSRIAKLLTGRVLMGVADMEMLCDALQLSPVEAVRDHGLEFLAEMSPTELRTLERIRHLAPIDRDAYLHLLDIKSARLRAKRPERPARFGKHR